MSIDFWAGYVSGVTGIIIGNPLDIIKIRSQIQSKTLTKQKVANSSTLTRGTAAPILGHGALNAILFVSYNRSEAALKSVLPNHTNSMVVSWLAGAAAGLSTWIISTPTELIKCRTQIAMPPTLSLSIARQIWRAEGVKGFYSGGLVTALRDGIGYGFYFWSYELANSYWPTTLQNKNQYPIQDTPRILLCGGFAGIATWASVFPLDVIKSRVQTQQWGHQSTTGDLSHAGRRLRNPKRYGAWHICRRTYSEGRLRPFFQGLTACSIRAFIVNAVQWMVYESIMREFGQGREQKSVGLPVEAKSDI